MDDYDVGFGKTPKHTRFKKGVSGNPKGRKSGSISLKTALQGELAAKISLNEGGKSRKISKMEALAKRLVERALSGDPRALVELLRQVNVHLVDEGNSLAKQLPDRKEDLQILRSFAARMVREIKEDEKDGEDK